MLKSVIHSLYCIYFRQQ